METLLRTPIILIIIGFLLTVLGVLVLLGSEETARGYYFTKIVHTIFGDSLGTIISGGITVIVGVFLIYNGIKNK